MIFSLFFFLNISELLIKRIHFSETKSLFFKWRELQVTLLGLLINSQMCYYYTKLPKSKIAQAPSYIKDFISFCLRGGGGWARTSDLQDQNLLFFQLNYTPILKTSLPLLNLNVLLSRNSINVQLELMCIFIFLKRKIQ